MKDLNLKYQLKNIYLKYVNGIEPNLIIKFLEMNKELENLTLQGLDFTLDDMKPLFDTLRKLQLKELQLFNITELEFKEMNLYLKENQCLKKLGLFDGNFFGEIPEFGDQLEEIEFKNFRLTANDYQTMMNSLKKNQNLKSLFFISNTPFFLKITGEYLSSNPNITHMSLIDDNFEKTSPIIDGLCRNNKIKSFEFRNYKDTGEDKKNFIKELYLYNNSLTDFTWCFNSEIENEVKIFLDRNENLLKISQSFNFEKCKKIGTISNVIIYFNFE